MERAILHCDCNSFYASVETLLRPELAQVPMAVCGDPDSRHGIILAKNERAKRFRVQTAETIWQAREKCPHLVLVPPHREMYEVISQQVNAIYQRYTDQVEPFGIDESWLDVTGSRLLFGEGSAIAQQLRETVKKEVGITISVGVSFNKVFAKLGSDYKKPDAVTVITRENFRQLLWPLPVSAMLYVGDSARATLHRLYVDTIGDLANCNRELLIHRLGKLGEQLHDYANGMDESPVRSIYDPREIKSVGNGMTFRRNLVGEKDFRVAVLALSDSVAARLRRQQMKCTTIQVTVRDPNFKTITRQTPLEYPTFLASELAECTMGLLQRHWDGGKPVRMLTITGSGLVPAHEAVEQISLFDQSRSMEREKLERLEGAMDRIRGKFGRDAVTFGGAIGNTLGIHDPTSRDSKKET